MVLWEGNLVLDTPFPPCAPPAHVLGIARTTTDLRLSWEPASRAVASRVEAAPDVSGPWETLAVVTGTELVLECPLGSRRCFRAFHVGP